jgi:hypothetical protein
VVLPCIAQGGLHFTILHILELLLCNSSHYSFPFAQNFWTIWKFSLKTKLTNTHEQAPVFRLSQTHTRTHTHLGVELSNDKYFQWGTNRGANSFEPHFWSLYEFDTLLTRFVFFHAQFQVSPLVLTKLGFLCHVWMTLEITFLSCFFCCCPWYLDQIWGQKQADLDKQHSDNLLGNLHKTQDTSCS